MNLPTRILVTGAAGKVGSALRPLFASRFESVLLTDINPIGEVAENETFEQGDLADLDFVQNLASQVEAIVHLGGMVGAHFTFEDVLGPNIVGTHNIFAAAHAHKISRIVYASSHHAVGFIRCGEHIDESTAHRPNSEYALSKAFGESAASYFADNYGLNILSIRIGYVGEEVSTQHRLRTWVSARDLAQLIEIGLGTPDLGHQIVYGVSDNPEPYFANANAFRLGYKPRDRSTDVVTSADVLKMKPDLDSIAGGVVGGGFASAGFSGDESRILNRTHKP